MRIKLGRKLADVLDGIDLSGRNPGDIVELPAAQADLLIAEGWAEPADPAAPESATPSPLPRAIAADAPPRKRRRR